MHKRLLFIALALAASASCKGARSSEPEPGPPSAELLGVFDPAALADRSGAPPTPAPGAPLAVLDHGPQGRTEGGAAVKIRFNQPVVGLGDEERPELATLLTFDPPLPGRAFFQTPELLVFQPDVDLADATTYTARLAPGLVGLGGQRLAQGLQWTFETPRPRVEGAPETYGDEPLRDLRRDSHVVLRFDQPTSLAEVRAHVQASARSLGQTGASARPVAVRVSRTTQREAEAVGVYDWYDDREEPRFFTVRAAGLWPAASEVEIAVTPGLRGTLGPLPLDTPWNMSFQTYVPQAVVASGCGGEPRCGLEPIGLTLRNPVREEQARKISISPRPKHLRIEVVDAYGDEAGTEVQIAGQFIPGTTYTVRVDPGLKDIYGQSFPGGFTRAVVVERRPELALSASGGTLIPTRPQTVGVEARFVQALRVRVVRIEESDLAQKPWREIPIPRGGTERTIPLKPEGPAGWASIALDLADLAGSPRGGAILLEVAAVELAPAAGKAELPDTQRALFRLTDLGPVVVASAPRTAVQVLRLSDSTPVAGARVSRVQGGAGEPVVRELGVTDGEGLLVFAEPPPPARAPASLVEPGEPRSRRSLIVVDPATGDRTAVEVGAGARAEGVSSPLRPGERLIARIVADRGAYRPGESVKVVGWSAVDTPFARSGLGRLPKGTDVKFALQDPTGAVVAERTTRTTAEGKSWAVLPIPAGGKLGRHRVVAALAGGSVEQTVKVEDYRVPEFSVTASVKKLDLLTRERATVRVAASYYFGGPVPIDRLTLQSSCAPTRYRPPGLDAGWSVGEPVDHRRAYGSRGPRITAGDDPAARPGMREVEVDTGHVGDDFPHRCTISAEVQDASFQGVGAETSVQLHPASFYLALAVPPATRRIGDRVALPVRAVDIQGARVAASGVKVMVERSWLEATDRPEAGRQVFAGYVEKKEAIKTCVLDVPAAGDDPRCELPPLKEGTYQLRVEADAGAGRSVRTGAEFWVTAAKRPRWTPTPAPPGLSVQTNTDKVAPGQGLEVAVRAPWAGSRGLLVLDRQGIRDVRPLALKDGAATFRFEADDSWTPAVHLRAYAVAPLAATRDKVRPEVQSDGTSVEQDAEHRRLSVRVEAPPKAGPGDRIELVARVRDAADAPVAARVALWAVDEAVLALTDYEVPDLLPAFVPRKDPLSREYDDYAAVMLPYTPVADDPWMSGLQGYGYGRGYGSGSGRSARVPSIRSAAGAVAPAARERFETTPIFLADLAADAQGEARVKAALPDNLTTFRIFAVASARLVDGASPGRFGVGDARTTVTTPFIVRAAAPRQLRPGDAAEVAAIVQNFTDRDGRAEVELVLHDDTGTPGQDLVALSKKTASVTVPAGGQARVPFTVRADRRGEAKLELRATLRAGAGAGGRDAIKVALPVEQERTLTERVAMYGTIDDDRAVAVPIVLPGAVRPDLGGVSVSASATLLGDLQDAAQALLTYPHGCVEQTSSRLLPVVSLAALHRTYPLGLDGDPAEFVKAGVERILSMQTAEGGFAYWPGGQEVHAYASAYATWVLQLAATAGHPVPADALRRAYDDLERRIGSLGGAPNSAWDHARLVRHAIGLHVLAEAGTHKREAMDELHLRRAELPVFGRAFLLMAMHRADPQRPEVQALTGELLADIEELPATAHVIERTPYDWGQFFHSDGRSDAIVLSALLRVRPEHPVVVKLARGLLERRVGGAWRNTQENAYALVALVDYARVYEADTPDFVARAWVGRRPVFEASFLGRAEMQTRSATAAMPELLQPAAAAAPKGPLTVVLQRQGQGRMYWRLGAEWAPADPSPPAKEHGLDITRALRLADGPLAGRPIGIGDPVAVDLTLTARTRIRYVALDIPIPAGLEAVQLDLGKGQRASTLTGPRGGWVSHEELRRDRVVVFADDLQPGTHVHTVYLRATSRGEFHLPPAHAEAMYMPEVWGRSAGERVAVR